MKGGERVEWEDEEEEDVEKEKLDESKVVKEIGFPSFISSFCFSSFPPRAISFSSSMKAE